MSVERFLTRMRDLTFLLPGSFGLLITFVVVVSNSWGVVTVGNATSETYQDLRQVMASSECLIDDSSRDLYEETCDPYDRPFNYPTFLPRLLASIGVTTDDTYLFAFGLIMLFWIGVIFISWLSLSRGLRWRSTAILTGAVISPPTMLLLERGNIDALIFFILALATLLICGRKDGVAAFLLGVATAIKIFPLGGGLSLIKTRRISPLLIFGLTAGIGVLLTLSDLIEIGRSTPQPIGGAFGSGLLLMPFWNWFNLPFYSILPRVFGFVIFFLVMTTLFAIVGLTRNPLAQTLRLISDEVGADMRAWSLISVGGGSFLVAYLAGTNFDYRLIFLIPVVAGFLVLADNGVKGSFVLAILYCLPLWLSYVLPDRLQLFMDFALVGLAPLLAVFLIRATKPISSDALQFSN